MSATPMDEIARDYVVCVDSASRDRTCFPSAAEFELPLPCLEIRGPAVVRVVLGSIELTLPRRNVSEAAAASFLRISGPFGIDSVDYTDDDAAVRIFLRSPTASSPPQEIASAVMPLALNPIVAAERTSPSRFLFTTLYPHGMLFDASTSASPPLPLEPLPFNPEFTITGTESTRRDRVVLSTMTSAASAGVWGTTGAAAGNTFEIFGADVDDVEYWDSITTNPSADAAAANTIYALHSVFQTPAAFAAALAARLNATAAVGATGWSFEAAFDPSLDRVVVSAVPSSSSPPPPATARMWMTAGPALAALGFSSQPLPFIISSSSPCRRPYFSSLSSACKQGETPPSRWTATPRSSFGTIHPIRIRPGHYTTAEELLAEIAQSATSYVWEAPGCSSAAPPPPPPTIVVSDNTGACFAIELPYGAYATPEILAAAVAAALNDYPDLYIDDFVVTYDGATGAYTIGTDAGVAIFGLQWSDPRAASLAFTLGFEPVALTGATAYTSNSIGAASCRLRSDSLLVPFSDPRSNRLGFSVRNWELGAGSIVGIGAPGTNEITVETLMQPAAAPYAHGLNVGDVVCFRDYATDNVYHLRVVAVPSATSFVAVLPTALWDFYDGAYATDSAALADSVVFLQRCDPPSATLHFGTGGEGSACASVVAGTARMLGFSPDTAVALAPLAWAPWTYYLAGLPYVLLQMEIPGASASGDTGGVFHSAVGVIDGGRFASCILAKIVAFAEVRYERVVPAEFRWPGGIRVNRVRFRVIDPHHQLIDFSGGGGDWSATLVFVAGDNFTPMYPPVPQMLAWKP